MLKSGLVFVLAVAVVMFSGCATSSDVSLSKLKGLDEGLQESIVVIDQRPQAKTASGQSQIFAEGPDKTLGLPLDMSMEQYLIGAISKRCAEVGCANPVGTYKITLSELDLKYKKANLLHKDYTIQMRTSVEQSGEGSGASKAAKVTTINANGEGRSGSPTMPGFVGESLGVVLTAYADRFVKSFLAQ